MQQVARVSVLHLFREQELTLSKPEVLLTLLTNIVSVPVFAVGASTA